MPFPAHESSMMVEFEKFLPYDIVRSHDLVALASDTLHWSGGDLEWRMRFRMSGPEGVGRSGFLAREIMPLCPPDRVLRPKASTSPISRPS